MTPTTEGTGLGHPQAAGVPRVTHMYIFEEGMTTDIERAAYRNASRSGRAVHVHHHTQMRVSADPSSDPEERESSAVLGRAACNDKCHIVQPDEAWPPGHTETVTGKPKVERPQGEPVETHDEPVERVESPIIEKPYGDQIEER